MKNECFNCRQLFSLPQEDLNHYEKIQVPPPTWCPFCRHIRRYGAINDCVYYRRNCDRCQKSIISIYPQKTDYTVYCVDCWWSDERDDSESGWDYDFSRGFFEQFDELLKATPQMAMQQVNCENSEYCQSVGTCNNCYLVAESSNNEDCLYCYWIQICKDCTDSTYLHQCEKCYETFNCFDSYDLKYSQNCINCSESAFLDNCIGCKNCLFSTNLRHKEFYIFNKPYSKEDYFSEFAKLRPDRYDQVVMLKEKFEQFLIGQPRKRLKVEQVENSFGDYMKNSKNCYSCFHCYDAEDFFGCSSLKPGAKYRILNKQYAEADYHSLVSKIKDKMKADGEYGEFFPLSISMFGYNNSVSFDDWSLTKEQVLEKW